jgi:tetratricopeptide (TPR) repeat protein
MSDHRVKSFLAGGALLALIGLVSVSGCGSPAARSASHIARGQKYLADGKLEKARVELSEALQLAPNDAEARYLNGRILERLGDPRGALALYQGTLEVDPEHLAARARLAGLHVLAGHPERALDLLKTALASHPDDPGLLTSRAAARAALEDDDGARADAERAVRLAPSSVDAVAALSALYVREGHPQQAVELLHASLKRAPESVELRQILAQVHIDQGESLAAEEQLQELVRIEPGELRPRLQLAGFYVRFARLDDAERTLKSLVAALPDSTEAKFAYADFLATNRSSAQGEASLRELIARDPRDYDLQLKLGELQQRSGATQAAIATFRAVIVADPTGLKGLVARDRIAVVEILAGRYAEAKPLLEEALAVNARDDDALTLRGNLALQEGDLAAAIADLRSVLRDQPGSAPVLRSLARAHVANHELALAEESLRSALATSPHDLSTRVELAGLLVRTERAPEAVELLEETVKAAPDAAGEPARVALVQAYMAKPDLQAAHTATDDLKSLQPDSPSGPYMAGLVAELQKRPEAAQREFERALKLRPGAIEPLSALARLEFARGQHAQAVGLVRGSLERAPGDAATQNLLGELLQEDGRGAEAATALQEAIRLAPKWWLPYRNLTHAELAAGDLAGAERVCASGVEATREPLLVMELAELYERQGRHEDAIREYETLHERIPRFDVAANNLAMLLVTYRSDRASLDRAQQLAAPFANSDVGTLLDTHGWVMLKRGDLAEALAELQRASAEAPDSRAILYHLGMAQLQVGERDSARVSLGAALAGGATFAGIGEARTALAQLGAPTG